MAKQTSKRNASKSLSLTAAREKSKMVPSVTALNDKQKDAIRAIANVENDIVMIDGIAGTGKTYLSASWGLEQLMKGKFDKIILTRPYVEAGESLGFLPGSFDTKIAPFMIPIFDVINEHLCAEDAKELFEDNRIMVLPLAYMRGVTFKRAFVLLDEAQNTTCKQMHLFLTRIGEGSKVVITGDGKQSDIGPNNGFVDALGRLVGVEGLEVVTLDPKQVVRHKIISEIDSRYSDDKR